MELASLAAQRSNCMKRRVGCVLVRERRVISTGYNGTPRHLQNCNEGGCKEVRNTLNDTLLTFSQVRGVIVAKVEALACPPVSVFMLKKMPCWRLEESAYEREQYCTAIRMSN